VKLCQNMPKKTHLEDLWQHGSPETKLRKLLFSLEGKMLGQLALPSNADLEAGSAEPNMPQPLGEHQDQVAVGPLLKSLETYILSNWS